MRENGQTVIAFVYKHLYVYENKMQPACYNAMMLFSMIHLFKVKHVEVQSDIKHLSPDFSLHEPKGCSPFSFF